MNLKGHNGRIVEQRIGKCLQERYAVVMTANIETDGTHGPRMEGNGAKVTLADMQVYGDRRGWLEVKAKNHANFREDRKWWEHGIDEDKFIHYCQLQKQTQMPVYLLICQADTGELLMADLDTLRTCGRMRFGKWPDGKSSVNWPCGTFTPVGMFHIPNGNPREMSVNFDWTALSSFLSQLELPI